MSSIATTSSSSEKIRAAVACFLATEPASGHVFVLLEIHPVSRMGEPNAQPTKRIAARRVFAGENKALEGRFTVVVGNDLALEPARPPVALTIHDRTVDVTVSSAPFGSSDRPFEGVFELRAVEIKKGP